MVCSSRLKKIIKILLESESYIRIEDIAQLLNISKRTVFRELKGLQVLLNTYELELVSKTGYGYRIDGNDTSKTIFLNVLYQQNDMKDREERQNLLTFELLYAKEIEKMSYYAQMFQVSEATISKDFDQIEQNLQKYQIKLSRKTGKMITVEGDEINKRKAITEIIRMDMNKQQVINDSFLQNPRETSILKMLDQEILGKIVYIFQTYYKELHLDRYAQNSYRSLIVHLVIMIIRIQNHEQLTHNEDVYKIIKNDVCFIQAKQICLYLEEAFQMTIPTIEIAFLALHMKGAKINRIENTKLNRIEKEKLMLIIEHMVAQYDNDIQFWLKQDEEFIQGLFVHLQPTIIRLQHQLPIYNPLAMQIKEEYASLFEKTKRASKVLEQEVNCRMNDDEIAFLTMHVGASLERKKRNSEIDTQSKVGIVCASGIGASALLSARIKKVFGSRLSIQTLTMQDLMQKDKIDFDFLISTIPLLIEDIEIVQVHPLLSTKDIQNIQAILKTARVKKKPCTDNEIKIFHTQLISLQDGIQMVFSLLNQIHITEIQASNSLEAIEEIIKSIQLPKEEQQFAIKALIKRESLGSLIMQDNQFIMYHALVPNLTLPYICISYPKDNKFTYANGIRFIITLLLPKQATNIQKTLFSNISKAIIEKPWFHEALLVRDERTIKNEIVNICKEYIHGILKEI